VEINAENSRMMLLNKVVFAYREQLKIVDEEKMLAEEWNAFAPKYNVFAKNVNENKLDINTYLMQRSYYPPRYNELVKKRLEIDVRRDSLTMFVVNYITAIIGKRRSDKNSISNIPIKSKTKEIGEFYEKHKNLIEELIEIRDKIFSHWDNDYLESINEKRKISFEEMKSLINDLALIIGYKASLL